MYMGLFILDLCVYMNESEIKFFILYNVNDCMILQLENLENGKIGMVKMNVIIRN